MRDSKQTDFFCSPISLPAGIILVFLPVLTLFSDKLWARPTLTEKQAEKLVDSQTVLDDFEAGKSAARVIVKLVEPPEVLAATDWESKVSLRALQSRILNRQREILTGLSDSEFKLKHRFENQAGFAGSVTLGGLYKLLDNPLVESIEPDRLLKLHLAQGIPLINASVYRSTYNGQRVSIAICDTGIDYNHSKLGGGGFPNSKVIGGYDFGDNDTNPIYGSEAHGTCTAGIAAGNTGTVGDYIGGVAYNAKIYALKVEDSAGNIYESYVINAWNWCVTHKNDDPCNPILVISNSFGGGRYSNLCDSSVPSLRDAANNAVAAGITILVSSGNDGYCDSIAEPACLSSVISVGAVYDNYLGNIGFCVDSAACAGQSHPACTPDKACFNDSAPDIVTCYSNTASFLNILAPSHDAYTTDISGSGGYSTGDYYTEFGGTSASCPYAAGAVACLQSAAKVLKGRYLTPSEVKTALVSTGDNITDGKPDVAITKPKVNLGQAIDSLAPPPNAPSNFAHIANTANSITWSWMDNSNDEDGFHGHDSSHTVKWTADANATQYEEMGLSANTQYTRHVHSFKGVVDSNASNAVLAYTSIESLTGVEFSAVTTASIQVRSAVTPSNLTAGSSGLIIRNTTDSNSSGWKPNNNYWTSGSLQPNTEYQFTAQSRNGNGDETAQSSPMSKWTLPAAPSVSSDLPTGNPSSPVGTIFTFTNDAGFGVGGVDHYHYVWDQNETAVLTGSEPNWAAGTLQLAGDAVGRWYLHLLSHSGDDSTGGSITLGSYNILDAPVLSPEPAVTAGTTNVVYWSQIPQAEEYYAECANDVNFTAIFANSGWIIDANYEFTGLQQGQTYWFRTKTGAQPQIETWLQTTQADFAADQCNDVSTTFRPDNVVLAKNTSGPLTDTIGNSTSYTSLSQRLRGNFFRCDSYCILTQIEQYFKITSSQTLQFVVYESATQSGTYNRIHLNEITSGTGTKWYSSGPITVNLVAGKYYCISAAWRGSNTRFYYISSGSQSVSWGPVISSSDTEWCPAPASLSYFTKAPIYYQRLASISYTDYVGQGNIVSTKIDLPSNEDWQTVNFTADANENTDLTVDVLDGQSGGIILTDVNSGEDISGIDVMSIKLRANLSTADANITPVLHDWSATYTDYDRMCESMWSAPEFSRQCSFIAGDFEPDCDVDMKDLKVLADAWLSSPGSGNWNPSADISNPPDNVINFSDFVVFAQNWLLGTN